MWLAWRERICRQLPTAGKAPHSTPALCSCCSWPSGTGAAPCSHSQSLPPVCHHCPSATSLIPPTSLLLQHHIPAARPRLQELDRPGQHRHLSRWGRRKGHADARTDAKPSGQSGEWWRWGMGSLHAAAAATIWWHLLLCASTPSPTLRHYRAPLTCCAIHTPWGRPTYPWLTTPV